MKPLINSSKILQGLQEINHHRILYFQRVSKKIQALNLKQILSIKRTEGTKNESAQNSEITKYDFDVVDGNLIKRSRFHRFRKEVKAALCKAYELE